MGTRRRCGRRTRRLPSSSSFMSRCEEVEMSARRLALVMAVCLAGVWAHGVGATVFPVTSAADSGADTLRAAIAAANLNSGADTITFAIPGAGVHNVTLTSGALPTVTGRLLVDGTSQPGYAGKPLVRLHNGTGNATLTGLDIVAGKSKVA